MDRWKDAKMNTQESKKTERKQEKWKKKFSVLPIQEQNRCPVFVDISFFDCSLQKFS